MPAPLLIVNPASGNSRTARGLPRMLERAERALGGAEVRFTTRRGHALDLAREGALAGHPLIVAVGGDGTFSEVANGVLAAGGAARGLYPEGETWSTSPRARTASPGHTPDSPSAPSVGLINLGTGGDFRRSLGIPEDFEGSLEALVSGRERLLDVGRASFRGSDGDRRRRYFVNVLSAGLGGLVDRYIDAMPSFLGGRLGYYVSALLAVMVSKEQPVRARITWGQETREETIPAYLVAICNGRWFGGGMDVAPMALPDDGRLEVVTVTAPSRLYLADKVRGVYTGRHLEEPTVHHFPCERLDLRLDDRAGESNFLLDVDGDPLGSLPLTVEIAPKSLRVRA